MTLPRSAPGASIGGTRNYGHPDPASCARYRDLLDSIMPGSSGRGDSSGRADSSGPMACAPRGPAPLAQDRPPRRIAECPEFADAELGAVARLRLDGWGVDAIAVELGITEMDALRHFIRRLEYMSGKTHRGRRRTMTSEEEAEIRRLKYDERWTIKQLADKYGRTESSLRYMLANPRAEP